MSQIIRMIKIEKAAIDLTTTVTICRVTVSPKDYELDAIGFDRCQNLSWHLCWRFKFDRHRIRRNTPVITGQLKFCGLSVQYAWIERRLYLVTYWRPTTTSHSAVNQFPNTSSPQADFAETFWASLACASYNGRRWQWLATAYAWSLCLQCCMQYAALDTVAFRCERSFAWDHRIQSINDINKRSSVELYYNYSLW